MGPLGGVSGGSSMLPSDPSSMAPSEPMPPSGIIAITLEEGDDLISAEVTDGTRDVFLGTRDGLSIRFNEADVRDIGRTGKGVIGVRLEEGNEVIGMEIVRDDSTILTVTENGFGKRSSLEDYRSQSRGGKGIITIKTTEKNGRVIGIAQVSKDDEILLITGNGKILRIADIACTRIRHE